MKTSNIISFIIMLVTGIVSLVISMQIEVVLKLSTFMFFFSAVNIIISVISFFYD